MPDTDTNTNLEKLPGLTVSKILEVTDGEFHGPNQILEEEVTGLQINSLKIEHGNIFAAFKGEKTDGNKYIPNAAHAGALVALTEVEQPTVKFPYIRVNSVGEAMAQIATAYRQLLKIPVVAIIGSVGKTSTKEAISNVLSQKFNVLKTSGNLNNELGLPVTLLSINPNHEVAVVEMGISHFGEMTRLAKMARPDILVFTNVGNCHLEFLGDKAGVLRAKGEALDHLHNGKSRVIVNGDDEYLATVQDVNGKAPLTFGVSDKFDSYVSDVKSKGLLGTSGTLHVGEKSAPFNLPLPGTHSIYNMVAAATVGNVLGMKMSEITAGIAAEKNISGHGDIITAGGYTILNEAYNANPESMRAALNILETAASPKVAILGDMFELGEDSAKLHYELGQFAATKNIDQFVLIGNLSKNILEGLQSISTDIDCAHFNTVREFMQQILEYIPTKSSILVKASNGMKFSQIVDYLGSV